MYSSKATSRQRWLTFDIVNFCNSDNDTDSENDLEGNNVEWDHLLESMTSSQPNQKVDKSTKGLQEKPLRLDLSAINKSDGQESPTIGRSRKSRDEKIQECTSPNFVGEEYNLGQGSSETEQIVEAEQERGSSPVKGIYNAVLIMLSKRLAAELYLEPHPHSQSD